MISLPNEMDFNEPDDPRFWAENAAKHITVHGTVRCDKHPQAKPVMACRHCHEQDEVHPDGVVFMEHHYFLCFKCLELVEKVRFKWNSELYIYCYPCIQEEIARLKSISPLLFQDLSK